MCGGGGEYRNLKRFSCCILLFCNQFKILLTYYIKDVQYLVKFIFSTSEHRFDLASMHICMTFICVLDSSGSCQM